MATTTPLASGLGIRAMRRAATHDRRRTRRRVAAAWGLLAVVVVASWPARFGGATSFVAVHGRSMEPTYHSGDLLVVRSDEPEVGDVAVYRLADGLARGGNVVHRVVGVRGDDRYVMQGDANEFPDDATPSRRDVIGSPIVNLGPWPMRALASLPLVAALAFCVAVGWIIWPPPPEGR